MKKIVIAILVILVIFLPIGTSDDRTLFTIFIVLWPISTITLGVLYFKWFDPRDNLKKITEVSEEFLKEDEQHILDKENNENMD